MLGACCAAVPAGEAGSATVMEHRWGEKVGDLGGPFEVIVACGRLNALSLLQLLHACLHYTVCVSLA